MGCNLPPMAFRMTPLSRLLAFTLIILLVLIVAASAMRWSMHEQVAPFTGIEVPVAEAERTGETVSAIRLLDRGTVALSASALVVLVLLVFSLGMRPNRTNETRAPFTAREREMRSISLIAATSARAQEEISLERGEREKAEEDSRQRLRMLNQALEEKIRIGRDLHDGVIQSLYAVGLNLESAQRLAEKDPGKSRQMVEKGVELINKTITEIRSYIEGLSTTAVRGDSLAASLADEVESLRAGRPLDVDWRIEDKAVAELSDAQTTESLQITREAVSNALRHGGANRISIHLVYTEQGAELSIRDNGTGFETSQASGQGYGLANMQGRAEDALGVFSMESTSGNGTCVQVLWRTASRP